MKQKELKNLAKKIAKLEETLSNLSSTEDKSLIENEIMKLAGKVTNINDMVLLDDLIQEEIAKS